MNALTVQYALDHQREGFTFMALCPGVRNQVYHFSLEFVLTMIYSGSRLISEAVTWPT
jgi:hypothetical protein